MKKIQMNAIITGLRSRSDGSLGLTVSTPSLKPEEKTVMFELQGINISLGIDPLDEKVTEDIIVDRQAGEKTLSERLRNVLFVLYGKLDNPESFEDFYRVKMNQIIEKIKERIAEYDS